MLFVAIEYCMAGNFKGFEFSQLGDLLMFHNLIYTDARSCCYVLIQPCLFHRFKVYLVDWQLAMWKTMKSILFPQIFPTTR